MSLHLTKKHSAGHWELAVTSAAGEAKTIHFHQGLALLGLCHPQAVLTKFEFNTWPRIQARQIELNQNQETFWISLNLSQQPEEKVRKLLELINKEKRIPLHLLIEDDYTPQPSFEEISHWLQSRPQPSWKKSELLRWTQNSPELARGLADSIMRDLPSLTKQEKQAQLQSASEEMLPELLQDFTQHRDLFLIRVLREKWTPTLLTVDRLEALTRHKEFVAKGLMAQNLWLKCLPRESRYWRITVSGNALHFRCDHTGAFGLLDVGAFKSREKFFQKFDSAFYQALFYSEMGKLWPKPYNSFVDLLCEDKTFSWGDVWSLRPMPPAPRATQKKLQIKFQEEAMVLADLGDGFYNLPPQAIKEGVIAALQPAGYFQFNEQNNKIKLIDPELRFEMGV